LSLLQILRNPGVNLIIQGFKLIRTAVIIFDVANVKLLIGDIGN